MKSFGKARHRVGPLRNGSPAAAITDKQSLADFLRDRQDNVRSLATQSNLRQFFIRGGRVRFKKNEIIVRADEKQPYIYFIQSGFVKVYSLHDTGEEAIQLVLNQNEFFPGRWIIQYKENDLYYEAMTDLVVWRRKRQDLREALEQDPNLLMEVTEYTYDIFRLFMDRLKSMQRKTAYGRLASYLLLLADRFGEDDPRGVKVACPVTHQHMANCINISRETASRGFERLKDKNIVTYDEQTHLIIVLDTKLLRQEAG